MKLPAVLIVVSATALAACSGGGESEGAATAPSASEGPAPAAEEAGEVALASLTGDAGAGEGAFRVCAACHSVEPGETRIGPSLHGVVGRDVGSIEGFRYSPANQAFEGSWTPENLFEYLENPRAFMPGTSMSFAGMRDPQDRADLIAYLETLN